MLTADERRQRGRQEAARLCVQGAFFTSVRNLHFRMPPRNPCKHTHKWPHIHTSARKCSKAPLTAKDVSILMKETFGGCLSKKCLQCCALYVTWLLQLWLSLNLLLSTLLPWHCIIYSFVLKKYQRCFIVFHVMIWGLSPVLMDLYISVSSVYFAFLIFTPFYPNLTPGNLPQEVGCWCWARRLGVQSAGIQPKVLRSGLCAGNSSAHEHCHARLCQGLILPVKGNCNVQRTKTF